MTEETLFALALEKSTAEERTAFLDSACANNPDLRRRLDDLLRCHADANRFLQPLSLRFQAVFEGPTHSTEDTPNPVQTVLDPTPKAIGPYQLRAPLGEGGMGIV
jgi:hypothetical protein